jgi:hypothetical protein
MIREVSDIFLAHCEEIGADHAAGRAMDDDGTCPQGFSQLRQIAAELSGEGASGRVGIGQEMMEYEGEVDG